MISACAFIEIARIDSVLRTLPENQETWLSPSEQMRLTQLRIKSRRESYLAGHWLARVLLARGFGGAPEQWSLLERKSQPPQVEQHGDAINISISHSGDWIAVAVANTAVGIDIEQRPRILDSSIEALLLNANEKPGDLNADTLLQRWVIKEAWIKRRCESALPVRLKQLQLHDIAYDNAEVLLECHALFFVGLALISTAHRELRCDSLFLSRHGVHVSDMNAPAAAALA